MQPLSIVMFAVASALCVPATRNAHRSFRAHNEADGSDVLEGNQTGVLGLNRGAVIDLGGVYPARKPEIWARDWHNTVMTVRLGHIGDTVGAVR